MISNIGLGSVKAIVGESRGMEISISSSESTPVNFEKYYTCANMGS
jgi:hypothetical protein